MQWLGRMARFDLAQVRRAMGRNGRSRMLRLNSTASQQGATGGAAAGAHRSTPPLGKTGAEFPRFFTEECMSIWTCVTRLVSLHRTRLDR